MTKPIVHLELITPENWKQCIALQVHDSQIDFVPSNLYSLAESSVYSHSHKYILCNAHGTPVGFVLYGYIPEQGVWKIFRFMIDAQHQGRGYGKAGLTAVLQHIATSHPSCTAVYLTYREANTQAAHLYAGFGFVEVCRNDDKITARLPQLERQ